VWGAAFLLLGLYLVPVLVSFCLLDPRGGVPWHQARRDPTGLSPDPAVTQEAVIQVFAAPAVAWRGLFSVHTWIAVKPAGAPASLVTRSWGLVSRTGRRRYGSTGWDRTITGSGLGRRSCSTAAARVSTR
jgi:hypothetical protein